MPFVVGGLVGIVWATVKRELPLLLEGVGGPWTTLSSDEPAALAHFALRPDEYEDALRSLQQLAGSIDSHIADRQAIVSAARHPSLAQIKRLEEWLDHRRTAAALQARIEQAAKTAESWEALLAEIDGLGRRVLQAAWRPIRAD